MTFKVYNFSMYQEYKNPTTDVQNKSKGKWEGGKNLLDLSIFDSKIR